MNNKRQYQAVLFDFDGTYADTAPDMVAALNVLRTQHDREPISLAAARAFVSHGSRALVELGFSDFSEPQKLDLIQQFLDAYEHNVAEHTRPFEGMENWIVALEDAGIAWGIVTNKPAYLTAKVLKQMHLDHPPRCVVSGDSLIKRKPHPMPVLHAAALLHAPADQCIYVGDARNDITAGRAAGMYTVIAAYGYILPDDDINTWNAHETVDSVVQLSDRINTLLNI